MTDIEKLAEDVAAVCKYNAQDGVHWRSDIIRQLIAEIAKLSKLAEKNLDHDHPDFDSDYEHLKRIAPIVALHKEV